MSKGNTFENDLLKLIFNGTAIGNIADNAAASPLGNLYFALHSSDPGEAGVQNTNEISYTGYGRVAVARSVGGFTVTANSVKPTGVVEFGVCTAAGGVTATHFSVGVASVGATKILYKGALDAPINVVVGVVPRLTADTEITED